MSDSLDRAMAGDVPAQREVADCYGRDCDGKPPNPVSACAWRIVAVASAERNVTSADIENRRRDCDSLTPAEQEAAATEAKAIFQKVHGRELVLPADFFGGNWTAPTR